MTVRASTFLQQPLNIDKLLTHAHEIGLEARLQVDGTVEVTCLTCLSIYHLYPGETLLVGAVICPVKKCNKPRKPKSPGDFARLLSGPLLANTDDVTGR